MMDHVKFIQMKDGDKEDYKFLTSHGIWYSKRTAECLLSTFVDLDKSISVYRVTRLGHLVQSATQIWRYGANIDWFLSTLLTILTTFLCLIITIDMPRRSCAPLSENNGHRSLKKRWLSNILSRQHIHSNPNKCELCKDHFCNDDHVIICKHWDQTSHNPHCDSKPLNFSDIV